MPILPFRKARRCLSLDEFDNHVLVLQEVYTRVQVTDVYQRGLLKGWNML